MCYLRQMALKPETLGHETDALTLDYDWQKTALYALGVGATKDELDFLYEGRGPKVLPTYAVIPSYDAVRELFQIVGGDMLGVVHGAQKLTFHKPFAPAGKLSTTGKVKGVYDLKRMAQAVFETDTRDENGELLVTAEWLIVYRLDGGFGGPRPPKTERRRPPEREPDWTVEEKTSPEQALLYRLNGDHNPLHADPEIGEQAGFGGPILHGLCTYGYAGRAVLKHAYGGDPAKLKEYRGHFAKPVFPGDTLIISGWNEDDGTVFVRMTTTERPDENVFSNAWAIVDKS